MPFPEVSKRYFNRRHHIVSSEYIENTRKTGNNAIDMSQVFHDIARFEHFTDLNVFKYLFNVIQNWQTDAFQFYLMVLIFFLVVMVEGDESSRLRMSN